MLKASKKSEGAAAEGEAAVNAYLAKVPEPARSGLENPCIFSPMQSSLTDAMKEELQGYRTSKGTLQFRLDKPLPAVLVKKMVKARVAENEARSRSKRASK